MLVLILLNVIIPLALTIASIIVITRRIRKGEGRIQDTTKRWVSNALASVETRIRYQSELVEPDNVDVVIIVTRNRAAHLQRAIESIATYESSARIIIVDVGSTDTTPRIVSELVDRELVYVSIRHRTETVPQWQKGYGIYEAWRIAAPMRPRSITVIDDDMLVVEPFLSNSRGLCEHNPTIDVVALHRDALQERNHPVVSTIQYEQQSIPLGKTFNGAAFYLPWKTLSKWGPPPINEGINDCSVEDWYYSRALQSSDGYAAFTPRVIEQEHVTSLREQEEK